MKAARKPRPWVILLTLALAAVLYVLTRPAPPDLSAAWAEPAAHGIWTRLQAVQWERRYGGHAEISVYATCEQFHGRARGARNADQQWCHRCLLQQKTHQEQHYFYAFATEEITRCRLQQFRAFATGVSVTALQEVHRALSRRLSARFGSPEEPPGSDTRSRFAFGVIDWGSASWRNIQRWRTDELEMVVYIDVPMERQPRLGLRVRHRHLLDALAQDAQLHKAQYERMQRLRSKLEQGLARELRNTVPNLAALLPQDRARQNADELPPALLRLLETAQTAEPTRRAALLLAAALLADQLTRSPLLSLENPSPEWDQLRRKLARYGVRYQADQRAGDWMYVPGLLARVWREHPATPWGEYAFLLQSNFGWVLGVGCAGGTDTFRPVIQHGEESLAGHAKGTRRPEVLFTVAQAYETWWSLSETSDRDPYVERSRYQPGAEAARKKAIAYYEQVVGLAPASDEAADARRRLPRLKLAIDTNQRRFFCIYD